MSEVEQHSQERHLIEDVLYPAHDPRKASEEYRKVHHHLVVELNEPCWICGIRQTNLPEGEHMETHHFWVEWALANGLDPMLVVKDFDPDKILTADAADAWLRQWLDSEGNMLVLCPDHHRHGLVGIHMITYPAWVSQRWRRTHDITKL